MFSHVRFRWAFADLVGNPGMQFEWDPYGIPLNAILKRAFLYENGKLRRLPPRQRAIVTALAMLETDLVPVEGKETLFLTCREYAQKRRELEATNVQFKRAEEYLKGIGLLQEVTMEALISKAEALGQALVDEAILKKQRGKLS